MANLLSPRTGRSGTLFAIVVALLAMFVFTPAPVMPAAKLDPSWMRALEYAADHGLVFGRDIIFTYGPFAALATRLFAVHSFGFVLLFSGIVTLLWLAPLTLGRRPLAVALYAAALLLSEPAIDSRVVAALLALCIVGIERPSGWTAVAATAFGPLALAKYSYLLGALPIFLLLDAYYVAALRRLPLATVALLGSVVASLLLAGQPPAAWLQGAYNNWQVIDGYSGAMQATAAAGGFVLIAMLLMAFAALLLIVALGTGAFSRAALAPWCLLAAVVWLCFIAFKMGYVRQDDYHVVISWQAFVLMVPPLAGAAAGRVSEGVMLQRLAALFGVALAATAAMTWKIETTERTGSEVAQRYVDRLALSPIRALAWLSPAHWQEVAEERRAVERTIRRRYSPLVTGTVDSIPIEVTQLVTSGLDYHPRPVPQSYSSYTPALQRADAAFFADPARAPRTVLYVQKLEVDDRLSSLGLGPSLPALIGWYDIVGDDRDAAVLRRRETPRRLSFTAAGARNFAMDQWVPVPNRGTLTFAAIDLDTRLSGRAMKLLLRDPQLYIQLRFADGSMREFRFIPGMAKVGFALSPTPLFDPRRPTAGAHAMIQPQADVPHAGGRVVAFRLAGGRISAISYSGGHVRFTTMTVAPDR